MEESTTELVPTNSQPNYYKIVSIVLLIIILFLLGLTYSGSSKYEDLKEMYEASEKETVFYKDELGRESARSETIKSLKIKDFTKAIFNDPEMKKLQEAVEFNSSRLRNGGSVTTINTGGTVNNTTSTTIINDTTYTSKFKDKWIDYNIIANKSETILNLKYTDNYTVTFGTEKDTSLPFFKRLFSEPKSYTWVTSESPYTTIKSTKTYAPKSLTSSRLSVGLIGGYGYDLIGLKPSVFVGVGTSYRLFDIGKKKAK
jgi:hypothetical protein